MYDWNIRLIPNSLRLLNPSAFFMRIPQWNEFNRMCTPHSAFSIILIPNFKRSIQTHRQEITLLHHHHHPIAINYIEKKNAVKFKHDAKQKNMKEKRIIEYCGPLFGCCRCIYRCGCCMKQWPNFCVICCVRMRNLERVWKLTSI